MPAWTKDLPESACSGAVNWCDTQPDFATAWASCERGDWMLWLVGIQAGPPGDDKRKPLVLATCECARLALGHFPKSEERPRTAIETAEKWARGEDGVTLANCRDAATHAADAYAAHAAMLLLKLLTLLLVLLKLLLVLLMLLMLMLRENKR